MQGSAGHDDVVEASRSRAAAVLHGARCMWGGGGRSSAIVSCRAGGSTHAACCTWPCWASQRWRGIATLEDQHS